ncbi:hypothetical protein [Streptomyces sp. NRRL B-24484]|uniref:hypothetical protein n=1 Tax=Streptomyces sp. NRRL B-24484 TaxID=1463833 RepID=UPI0006945E9D|nr:hypothetical protein [Streptomyces sp. NRRL B-24484]
MHVHFIAPDRYVRASHEIVRHPRLRSTAKTLLLWALSLPPGSRETVLTIGHRMAEGRIAVSRARSQLIDEGYLHVRRHQHPVKGTWTTDVMVTSVPLRTAEEIAAAWEGAAANDRTAAKDRTAAAGDTPPSPARRIPALGRSRGRQVGTSPDSKTAENTPPPDGACGPEARLLLELARHDTRLRLSAAEAAALAPLAADWLTRDARPHRLLHTLLAGLPERVHSPQALLRTRLQRGMPAAAPAAAPAPRGLPPDLPPARVDAAAAERNRVGAGHARELLRGARIPRPAPAP